MVEPLVSIIIPVYNGSNYMREAIDSALSQTYKNMEVIVVNDGSNDNGETDSIALSYGEKIRYFSKENGGVSSALNLGVRMMKGDYMSWLSHDDVYSPTKVENQVELLKEYEYGKTIAMCSTHQINAQSKLIGNPLKSELPSRQLINWEQALTHVINYSCNGCALLIPKTLIDQCEDFDERLRYSQDFLMWVRLFMSGCSLVYNDDVDVLSRVHVQQVTVTKKDLFLHDGVMIAEMLVPKLSEISTKKNAFLYLYAKTNAVHFNRVAVDHCIEYGRKFGTMTAWQRLNIRLLCGYGSVRPYIRKIYYRVFKRMKNI